MNILFFMILFIFRLVKGQPCISLQRDSQLCLACSSAFFQLNPKAKTFPESECILKEKESFVSKNLILVDSSGCGPECRSKFSAVYSDLESGLAEQSFLASRVISADIEIFLSLGDHYLVRAAGDITRTYFRSVNVSLKIAPLSCDFLNEVKLCIPRGEQAFVRLKTNNLLIFVARKLEISFIKFTALDQHYQNEKSACLYSYSENCCFTEENVYGSVDSACSLYNFDIDYETRAERFWGFFNFEALVHNESKIEFYAENSEFSYFFLLNQKTGFVTLFSALWNNRVLFKVFNCSFSNSFFLRGIFYYEHTIAEPSLELWFEYLDESLRTPSLLLGTLGRNILNISNSSFFSYNPTRIKDNRRLEEKGLLLIDASSTEIFISDITIDTINAQDLDGQSLIKIESPKALANLSFEDCALIQNIFVNNASDFVIFSAIRARCIEIKNVLVQMSSFQNSYGIVLESAGISIKNSTFSQLLFQTKSYLIKLDTNYLRLWSFFILWSINPRISIGSSICEMKNISLFQIQFNLYLIRIINTNFTMESSHLSSISTPSDQQDVVIYQQENNCLFSNVSFEDISASTLKFLDKTGNSSFYNCSFLRLYDVSNFIAAESIYIVYLLQNSSIRSCAFLNFYISLNGNKFVVQPKMLLYGLSWSNCTVRVGYFSAFSNVVLELVDSEIRDMVGIKEDNFVRFFYIGRGSSFFMDNSKVIDCGYTFEPSLINQYAYNYQLLLGQFINSSFKVVNSLFETNKPLSLKTGYIALNRNTGKVSIVNCSFTVYSKNDQFSHSGITFTTTNEIEFINNTVVNITCPAEKISVVHEWGAVFMYGEETDKFFKNNKKAVVSGNYFENSFCRGGGALTIVNYHEVYIENNQFKNNAARFQIGSFGIWASSNVSLKGNIIYNSFSPSIGAIKIQNVRAIAIQYLYVKKAQSYLTAVLYVADVQNIILSYLSAEQIESFSNGGFIYAGNTNLTVVNSIFANIATNVSGGVFFIDIYSNFSINNCFFTEVNAYSGGVVAVFKGAKININNTYIINVTCQSNGAAFLFEQFLIAEMNNISFINNFAKENGVISFESSDESLGFTLVDILCLNNKALAGSCLYINSNTNITILRMITKQCEGVVLKISSADIEIWAYISHFSGIHNEGENTLNFESVYMVIEEMLLENNIAYSTLMGLKNINKGLIKNFSILGSAAFDYEGSTIGILIDKSDIVFESLNFDFTATNSKSLAVLSQNSQLIITSSHVFGSYSQKNEGAIILIDSRVVATDIIFFNNYGVCLKGSGQGGIFKRILFMCNEAINMNEAAHIEYTGKGSSAGEAVVLIFEEIDSSLQNDGIMIALAELGTVSVLNCSFRSALLKQNSFAHDLRGIYALNIENLSIMNSVFENLTTGGRGSALFVAEYFSFGEGASSPSLLISESIFRYCSSYEGAGAVYISNERRLLMESNVFQGNSAKYEDTLDLNNFEGIGGVGIILCISSKVTIDYCRIALLDNLFEDNYAYYHSPLFYINSSSNVASSIYSNNSDKMNFTREVTSHPLDIKIVFPLKELGGKYFHLNPEVETAALSYLNLNFSENQHVLEIRSGVPVNISFFITDSTGETLVFDKFSYATIDVVGSFKYQINIENGVTKAEGGWFNFTNTKIFGWPDSTVNFEFSFKIPEFTILNPELIIIKKRLYVHFRPCDIGEIILYDLKCSECPTSFFSTADPMKAVNEAELQINLYIPLMTCSPCLKGAYCPGGWRVFPEAGNWRLNNQTEKIIECLIPEACVGYNLNKSIYENLVGVCREGHSGNLCHDCIHNYGKMSPNSPCVRCEDVVDAAVLRLLLVVLIIITYSIFGSFLYSRQREKKQGFLFVYLRIGISFSQITSLLTFIKVEWPVLELNQIQTASSSSLSLSSEDVLLNDCLLQKSSLEPRLLHSLKTIISIFLPVLLFILISLIWLIYIFGIRKRKMNKDNLKDFYTKILASLIISVFLFHPLIIKSSFSMLNCFVLDPTINQDEFLFVYPNFKCWDTFHFEIILFAVLPGIFLWGLGFPLGLLYLLRKQMQFKKTMKSKKKKTPEPNSSVSLWVPNLPYKGIESLKLEGSFQVISDKLEPKSLILKKKNGSVSKIKKIGS